MNYTSFWLAAPRFVIKLLYGKLFATSVFCSRSVELIERLSMTFTANGKNETFAVCLQLSV